MNATKTSVKLQRALRNNLGLDISLVSYVEGCTVKWTYTVYTDELEGGTCRRTKKIERLQNVGTMLLEWVSSRVFDVVAVGKENLSVRNLLTS